MTSAEMKAALKTLDTTLKANAKRPTATRPLFNSGGCTHPGCTRCGHRGTRR